MVGLVGTLVLIRFVSPTDYGETSAAVIIVGTVNMFSTLGVGVYAIATREATREDLFHATFIHLVLGLVAFLGLLILGKPLSPAFGAPNMYHFVPFLAAAALADRVAFMPERVLIRNLRFKRVSLIRSVGEVSYAIVSVVAAWRGFGGAAIVAGNVVRSVIKAAMTVQSVDRHEWFQLGPIRMSILKKIGGYGVLQAIGSLGYYATIRWDNLLVSRFFGPAVMGAYNLAYSLAEIPATHVAEQITDVMQASYAHMGGQERRQTLVRAFAIIALITFPLAVGLGAVAPTLADLFLNKKWEGTGTMLMVLAMVFVARPPYSGASAFITVERGPKPLIVVEWVTVAALMVGLLTVGRISPIWACGAVGVAFTVRMLLGMFIVSVSAGMSFAKLLGLLIGPLVACAPMAAAVFGVRYAIARLGIHSSIVRLAAEVLVGGAVFVGSALVVVPGPAGEVLRFVRRRANRGAPALAATDVPASPTPPSAV